MPIPPCSFSPNELTIDDAFSLLLHPANRVHIEDRTYYVYMLFTENDVLYIGYTDHMSQRRSQHKQDGRIPFTSSSFITLRDETEAKNLERKLIAKHCPPYNRQLTDALLTGTAESRQQDRLEKIRQRDADGLARLEKLRCQRGNEVGVPRDPRHAEAKAQREADRQVRVRLWRDLLPSSEAKAMNEFEAVAYINRKWGEAVSSQSDRSLQGFNAEHAVRYGIEEAAVISLFQDWLGFNRAMGRSCIDGRTYTSETVEGFASHVRFLNAHRMRDALDRVIGTGVLDKISIPTRAGRMFGYAFHDEEGFLADWYEQHKQG